MAPLVPSTVSTATTYVSINLRLQGGREEARVKVKFNKQGFSFKCKTVSNTNPDPLFPNVQPILYACAQSLLPVHADV